MSEFNITVLIVCSMITLIVFFSHLFGAIRRKREMAVKIVEMIDYALDLSIYQCWYLYKHGEMPPEDE